MRKIIFTTICLITTCLAYAQEAGEYKPQAGFYTLELGLTGGLMDMGINLSESTLLRGRYFLSNQTAVRLGINISSKTDKTNFWESLGSKNKGVYTENAKSVTINLG